jgi:peptidoglycan/xylan/chitin deacetylase (PgdA/CDA1 family)
LLGDVPELPRAGVKRAAEILLARSGIAALARRWRGGGAQAVVLAYHNVRPDGAPAVGDGSLHLPRQAFAAQLDQLRRTHDVVPLDTLLDPPPAATARRHRPRAALTFDDAYRGAITVGLAEVVARGMPATVFIAPQFVGGGTFWWDALADPPGGEVRPDVRAHAVEALAGDDAAVHAWARGAGLRVAELPAWARVAAEDELRAVVGLPGITCGAHSWGHPNLTRIAAARLQDELRRPLQWLRERFTQVIDWLAYPYGCWSPAVAEAAAGAGYRAALRVEGGWLPPSLPRAPAAPSPPERFQLPRLNVPAGVSAEGFVLRSAGLLSR